MTQAASARNRLVYLDVLNIVSMVFVVFLHVRASYWDKEPTAAWWIENVLSGIGVCAVPIFLMNSGANLVDFTSRETIPVFLRKRFSKVLVPYLIWGQLYLVFNWGIGETELTPATIVNAVVNGSSVAPILWYLEAALGIYLAIPVVALTLSGARHLGWNPRNLYIVLLVLAFANSVVLPTVRTLGLWVTSNFIIPFGSGYLIYPLLGYALAKTDFTIGQRRLIYALGLIGLCCFIFGGGYLMVADNSLSEIFNSYWALSTVLTSSALFVLARYSGVDHVPERFKAPITRLAGLTFGIYLLHLMLIQALDLVLPPMNPLLTVPYGLVIWLISAVLVFLLRLIPPIRHWVIP